MQRRGLSKDKSAQAIPIDYILIFSIAVIFFGMIMMSFSSVVDNLSSQAVYTELTDIGNQISSAITSAYMAVPLNGETVSVVNIPEEVAGTGYFIDISDENPYERGTWGVRLKSINRDVTVFVPLNNVNELVRINGSASSASGKIMITSNISGIMISQG